MNILFIPKIFLTKKEVFFKVMLSQVKSMSVLGLDGYLVHIQVDLSSGLPSWDIVGLPDTAIKESKQRVHAALKNIHLDLPSRKIIINLAPANLKKEGSNFDLPIAIGLLCDLGLLTQEQIEPYIFVGELSLDGSLNKVAGILPMCTEALQLGITNIIVPFENRLEASIVKGLSVFPAKNLNEVIAHLCNQKKIAPFPTQVYQLTSTQNTLPDFAEVKGQESVKRALEIAAAGNHNCLLIGAPGSGKTMLSRRLPSILPDLTFEEALEITKIHSIAGTLGENAFITTRPFRSPHHSISKTALIGGGKIPKPRRNKPCPSWRIIS